MYTMKYKWTFFTFLSNKSINIIMGHYYSWSPRAHWLVSMCVCVYIYIYIYIYIYNIPVSIDFLYYLPQQMHVLSKFDFLLLKVVHVLSGIKSYLYLSAIFSDIKLVHTTLMLPVQT